MQRILIIGGGYAGFYTAWRLEKRLRRGEAEVTIVDPRPYMTYQPFLPEVASGSIEPRHVAISLRRGLRQTRIIAGSVVELHHDRRSATVRPGQGPDRALDYDIVVVTAGAITRTFPIPGVRDEAIGLKYVEEAVAIRDRLLTAFDRAATLPAGPERAALLTVTFVGGGFSGVEGFGELLSLATALFKQYPELSFTELRFHLVEAASRILPEVTDGPGRWVVRHLEERGALIHLGTQLLSASDGHVVLSNGEEFDTGLLVWTAGNASTPIVAKHTDLPIDSRGRLLVRADLQVGTEDEPVDHAWGAGDDAAIPDLAGPAGSTTVPNAQHAVRQGKRLAKNILASIRGRRTKPYVHHSLGVVATLGLGRGIFQYRHLVITGFVAWMMHRGYHVLAVPTWQRKVRILLIWATAVLFGRDVVSLRSTEHPRAAFEAGGEPAPAATRRGD